MIRPFELLFPFTGVNHDRWAQLAPAISSSSERWVIVPKYAGFFWTYRRWTDGSPRERVTAHGYQDLEHWVLTYYRDRLSEIVTLVHRPEMRELHIVLRGDLFDAFRKMPMKQGPIIEYSWRFTRSQHVWVADVRPSWERAWRTVTVESVEPAVIAPSFRRPLYSLPDPDDDDD